MSGIQAFVGGVAVKTDRWTMGTTPDGAGWASFEMTSPTVRPHDRIVVADRRGRPLWTGVAYRVTTRGGTQEVDVNDLTATILEHRISANGEYDPHFRFGDVITARNGNGRLFLVITAAGDGLTTVLPLGETDLMHDQRLRPDEWEIVE